MKKFNDVAVLKNIPEVQGQRQQGIHVSADLLRSVYTSQQFQLVDAQDRVNLLLAALLVQSQARPDAPEYLPQPVQQLAKNPVLLKSTDSACQPCANYRIKLITSKVRKASIWLCVALIKTWVWYHVLFGTLEAPVSLYKGVYQLLVFGGDSMCADYKTCEGAPKNGLLGGL